MSTTPPVIQRFIVATNAGDTAAFLEAFTPDAFLSDWGRDFTGRAGVAKWNETDNIGVQSKFRLLEIEPNGADACRCHAPAHHAASGRSRACRRRSAGRWSAASPPT